MSPQVSTTSLASRSRLDWRRHERKITKSSRSNFSIIPWRKRINHFPQQNHAYHVMFTFCRSEYHGHLSHFHCEQVRRFDLQLWPQGDLQRTYETVFLYWLFANGSCLDSGDWAREDLQLSSGHPAQVWKQEGPGRKAEISDRVRNWRPTSQTDWKS